MAKNGDRPQTVAELAEELKVDELLLSKWTLPLCY
jgi:hypothetical protein